MTRSCSSCSRTGLNQDGAHKGNHKHQSRARSEIIPAPGTGGGSADIDRASRLGLPNTPHPRTTFVTTTVGSSPIATRRILIVDDDPSVTETFERMLRLEGYQLVTALSAQAGLTPGGTNKIPKPLSSTCGCRWSTGFNSFACCVGVDGLAKMPGRHRHLAYNPPGRCGGARAAKPGRRSAVQAAVAGRSPGRSLGICAEDITPIAGFASGVPLRPNPQHHHASSRPMPGSISARLPARAGRPHAGLVHAPGGPLHARVPGAARAIFAARSLPHARSRHRGHAAAGPADRARRGDPVLRPAAAARADGHRFDFVRGEGPAIENPVRSRRRHRSRCAAFEPREALGYVLDAIRQIQRRARRARCR